MKAREFFLHLATIILSGASLIFGLKNDLYGLVGSQPLNIAIASFGVAILLLLLGERIAIGSRLQDTETTINKTIDTLKRSLPSLTSITRFSTCDDAIVELANRLQTASVILNTRVSRDGVQSGNNAHKEYHRSIRYAFKNGARMVDLVSSTFEDEAKSLEKASSIKGCRGEYSYHLLDPKVNCFLNFTVLQYTAGHKELWLGWATSSTRGMEQPAFRVLDYDVVSYFEAYHEALRNK